MKNRIVVAVLMCLVAPLQAEKPETLVTEGYSEKQMDKAMERARAELPAFLKALKNVDGESHSFKLPVRDGEAVEHFWIVNISYKDGVFSGEVGNEPGIVKNVKFGQKVTAKKEEISDWMYLKLGKIHGGYTIDPLLPTMPKEEADKLRAMLVR